MSVPTNSKGQRLIDGYEPTISLAVVGIVVYVLLSAGIAWRLFISSKRGQRWMWPALVGTVGLFAGFVARIAYAQSLTLGAYIAMTLFLLLPQCFTFAAAYRLLGRMALSLGDDVSRRALPIRATLVAKLFVTSDVVTFLIQAGGGGLSASPSSAEIGNKIALVGVIVQLVFMASFSVMFAIFGLRVRSRFPELWHQGGALSGRVHDWRVVWVVGLLQAVMFLVRSVYRAIEFAQGYGTGLRTVEWAFYALDPLPMGIASMLWIIVWPPVWLETPQPGYNLTERNASNDGSAKWVGAAA